MIEIRATRFLTNGETDIEFAVTFAVKDDAKWDIDVFRSIPVEDLELPPFEGLHWRDMTEEEYKEYVEKQKEEAPSYGGCMADYDDIEEDVYEEDEDL